MNRFSELQPNGEPMEVRLTFKKVLKRPLEPEDVNVEVSEARIKEVEDFISHLIAADMLRRSANPEKLAKAQRIEKLCAMNPRFGFEYKRIRARNVLSHTDS